MDAGTFNLRLAIEHQGRGELGVTAVRTQHARDAILETLADVRREDAGPADRDGLGRWVLSIPFEDYVALRATWPELSSSDPVVKSAAYKRFLRHPDSAPYRMRG